MHYYVIAEASAWNEGELPKKYWWGPFTETEARYQYKKRVDMYSVVKIVKEFSK